MTILLAEFFGIYDLEQEIGAEPFKVRNLAQNGQGGRGAGGMYQMVRTGRIPDRLNRGHT